MNHLAARQRESNKRWDYTCKRDGMVWPIGYCAGWREPQPGLLTPEQASQWLAQSLPHKDKFHTDGHDTEAEACECYKRYLLDFDLRLCGEAINMQRKCAVCSTWTSKYAQLGYQTWFLCEEHRTRDQVEKLCTSPGQCWEG
jgi:hypothetical protein